MKLAVFSHKPCWHSANSPSGFATDGGFPFQMAALSDLFDETRLLVPVSSSGPDRGEIPLQGHHVQVVPLSPRRGSGLSAKLSFFPWLLWNGPAIFCELLRADAVHAPIPGDVGTVGMLGAWLCRKPLFVRYCGNWLTIKSIADRFWHWFIERFAGGRNVMLATGGAANRPSARAPDVHWIFSTSLTEGEIGELAQREVELDPKNLRLITVGRQEAGKGTDKLVEALPLLARHYPHVRLEVVGDGSDMPRLQRKANELRVGGQVIFRGKVDHGEVLELMQQAHIFCFPSQSEGFPKAVLEALACGLPVIATRVSALPMLLSTGSGVLIEPEPSAIAAAVCEVVSSGETYKTMSAKARETAREYTLERWRDAVGGYLAAAWGPLKKRDEGGKLKAESRKQKSVVSSPVIPLSRQ
jgi:glycosyltransferase involved in cell wall biosynthesis